jgi:uncharacterized protein involved in type VI secretion and phage assembly
MPEKLVIKIDGTAFDPKLNDSLIEVIVDTNLFLSSMFSILVQDDADPDSGKMEYIDSDKFKVGAQVKIEMETDQIPGESTVKATLIEGEVTAIEPVFSAAGPVMLRVRGYDRSHRLTRGKKTRTFLEMTDADLVRKIAGDAGLTAEVDTTSQKYDYVMQYNQTDWDFLWSRARRLGHLICTEGKKLVFKKPETILGTAAPATLTWGNNLRSFEPRLSVMGQVSEVETTSWDPGTKQAIVGKESGAVKVVPEIGLKENSGGVLAKKAFGAAVGHIADVPVQNQGQAQAISKGVLTRAESTFIQAEGECANGDPRLLAGRTVEVAGVGTRFSGKYHVTEARHEYSRGVYTVNFGVTGQAPNTLHALLDRGNSSGNNNINGVVTAVVTDLNDTEKLGRVKVKFPWLPKNGSAEVSSTWARLAVPSGGKERGFFFTPEVDDEVLVIFEHGDVNFPYIVGALWNKKDKPPAGTAEIVKDGTVNQRVIRSRSGHTIILDDTKGKEQIIIQDKSAKNSIVINSKDKSMTIKAEGDLIFEAGGKFTVTSKGDVSVDSKAKATISSQSALSVESKQKATVKSGPGEMAVQASGTALKGTTVEINGSAKTDVKGGAMVQIQGGIVKIN